MNKKGDFAWETLAKLMVALLLLVLVLGILYLAKEKIISTIQKFGNLIRFGG